MTKLTEMGAALTAYQPQADAAGHGISWAKMCREKTSDDAYDAADDAYDAAAYDTAAYDAADAAVYAAAAYDAADAAVYADAVYAAEKWAQKAIEHLNKVLAKPAPLTDTELINRGCHYQTELTQPEKQEPDSDICNVVAVYTTPPAPLTDEQQIAEALRNHGLTLVKTATGYDVMSLGQITAHGIKENT